MTNQHLLAYFLKPLWTPWQLNRHWLNIVLQMRLCIIKLGIVSSIYGDFWEVSGGDARAYNLPLAGVYKGILFWRSFVFINLKTFVRMQNLAFVRSFTFRMKSTERFIHEAPGLKSMMQYFLGI